MNRNRLTMITQAALIAALYVALTYVFQPISFGEVQIRIAEALTILPVFTAAAVPGLTSAACWATCWAGLCSRMWCSAAWPP